MKTIVLCIVSFLSLSLNAQEDTAIIATAGSKKITKKEFDQKYKEVLGVVSNPPTKEEFLEDLIRYEIGLQEAFSRKMDQDPMVQERFRQFVYAHLLEKEVGTKVDQMQITEKELEAYYKKNPELRTSHILIELKDKATPSERDAARKRAQEIYQEVAKSKRPFEDLVKLYSDDSLSKRNGGDIGWHSSVTLLPPYYTAALKLSKDQISPLVETKFGFHIIKLTGKREFKDADKMQLSAAVRNEKKRELLDSFFKRLKSKYPVKVNNKTL